MALAAFYGQADHVLSPSPASDQVAARPGHRAGEGRPLGPRRRHRALPPELRDRERDDDRFDVLYAGRLTKEKGADLLAGAFLAARARTRACTSSSPAAARRRTSCARASASTRRSSGWQEGDDLARAYANADLFLFASRTDTFGQVLLEAQASGLAGRRGQRGRPALHRANGVSGRLCPANADALAAR